MAQYYITQNQAFQLCYTCYKIEFNFNKISKGVDSVIAFSNDPRSRNQLPKSIKRRVNIHTVSFRSLVSHKQTLIM